MRRRRRSCSPSLLRWRWNKLPLSGREHSARPRWLLDAWRRGGPATKRRTQRCQASPRAMQRPRLHCLATSEPWQAALAAGHRAAPGGNGRAAACGRAGPQQALSSVHSPFWTVGASCECAALIIKSQLRARSLAHYCCAVFVAGKCCRSRSRAAGQESALEKTAASLTRSPSARSAARASSSSSPGRGGATCLESKRGGVLNFMRVSAGGHARAASTEWRP